MSLVYRVCSCLLLQGIAAYLEHKLGSLWECSYLNLVHVAAVCKKTSDHRISNEDK